MDLEFTEFSACSAWLGLSVCCGGLAFDCGLRDLWVVYLIVL